MKFYECTEGGYSWLGNDTPFRTPGEVEKIYDALTGDQRELFERICRNLPKAEDYFRSHMELYGWHEEWLEDTAGTFTPQKLAGPITYFDPPWSCFENSFRHAEKTGLLYVEGLAIAPNGPHIHAWNSSDGTDVFDYTWPYQHMNHYFGITFPIDWMKEHYPAPGGILGHLHVRAMERLKKSVTDAA